MDEVQVRDLLPEDAYDAGDPLELRLELLERWIISLLEEPDDATRRARARGASNVLDRISDQIAALDDRIDAARSKIRAAD